MIGGVFTEDLILKKLKIFLFKQFLQLEATQ